MLPKQRLRRAWFNLQNGLPRINRTTLCVAVPLFFLLCTFAVWTLSSDGLRERTWFGSMTRSNFKLHSVPELDPRFSPEDEVAWAIPVGGRTRRSESLRHILTELTHQGVRPSNIFVFEDVLSRPDGLPDPGVADVAKYFDVRVVHSRIDRNQEETHLDFGIHLARHYHFMLDSVFLGHGDQAHAADNPDQAMLRTFSFAVVLEDDLKLAPDVAKFFHESARVMKVDPTLYCASAHQDNAYPATCQDAQLPAMLADEFDFRRGNHFMAPGWMTSADIYLKVVRPWWLDEDGNYAFKDKFKLKNGHWDRFFDTQIQSRECIFPEVPRILHKGADGFTVDKHGQRELYDNLVLSKVPPTIDYGDMRRLTAGGYENAIQRFILDAKLVDDPDEIANYRHSKLVCIVDASGDQDRVWTNVLAGHFGVIGVGGYGGNPMYAKQRGIHRGSVFIRWLSNLVLLVAEYSPYRSLIGRGSIAMRDDAESAALKYEGCFIDSANRELPHLASWNSPETISPARCVTSCRRAGFKFAGLQMGEECWCGDSLSRDRKTDEGECNMRCGGGSGYQFPCGGAFRNSVYWSPEPLPNKTAAAAAAANSRKSGASSTTTTAKRTNRRPSSEMVVVPPDAVFVRGLADENCVDACARAAGDWAQLDHAGGAAAYAAADVRLRAGHPVEFGTLGVGASSPLRTSQQQPQTQQQQQQQSTTSRIRSSLRALTRTVASTPAVVEEDYSKTTLVCNAQLFPLLHEDCEALQELMGCERCMGVKSAELGWSSPGMTISDKQCLLSRGNYLQCRSSPPSSDFVRACVCEIVPLTSAPAATVASKSDRPVEH